MKLKLNQNGTAVVRNGMPVYVHANGREEEFDAPAAMKLAIGKHFETSKAAGGLKIPHDLAAAFFGDAFRIEKGQLVAYTGDVKVYSNTRHGEAANFEEALGQLIDRYPNKNMILREPSAPAPGAAPGQQRATGSTITRAQFDSLPSLRRGKFLSEGGRIAEASAAAPAGSSAPAAQVRKEITRATFDQMPQMERHAFFKAGGKVGD